MITNERQYKITKSQAEKFDNSLRSFDKNSPSYQGNQIHFEAIGRVRWRQFDTVDQAAQNLRGLELPIAMCAW